MFIRKKIILLFLIIAISYSIFPRSPIELYHDGKAAYIKEEYNNAIHIFKKALELNPNYLDVLLELSQLYFDIGNYDYAYKYINRAIQLSSQKNDLIIFSAVIETKLKMYDIAEKKLKSILAKDRLNVAAHNALANLYLETNKKILAKKILDNVIKTEPNNFDALNMLAKYYESIDKIKYAEKYYILNIENNSLNPDSFFYYSIFNFNNNKINEAVKNIKTALSISDKLKYKNYHGKYLLFLNRGDEALKIFREVVKRDKNNYLNFYYLALAYYLISDFETAVTSLSKVKNLREDDEFSAYFLNFILMNKYDVDTQERIDRAKYFYLQAMKAKEAMQYNLFIFYLKESIRLYPKIVKSRLELAKYFLSQNLPERYLREIKVALKYTKDQDLIDRVEIEQKKIAYKLGDDWGIDQYTITNNGFNIPIFITRGINNFHYNCENIYVELLKNLSYEKTKFYISIFDEKEYNTPDKMKTAQENNSPFYLDLLLSEAEKTITVTLKLYNSLNNELIKEYITSKNNNNRVINSANKLLSDLNKDLPFIAKIIKISNNNAVINAGRMSGIKPNDDFVILKNKNYPIELNRANFIYNSDDIKGYGKAIKVDENICQIKFKDDDYFSDIDIDDIIIFLQ